MFSLSTVWKTIFTCHTRIARRGRDGAREDRSAGWSPQAHSSHVVGCTSHPADAVREKLVTNCDIICTFVMIKLASWCKRSAACTVRSRPICSSQYSGVRPSNRADSGAPIYSIIRGSCRWMPYDGSRSSRFVRSSYDVIRYWQPAILSNTIGDCPVS